ncbi:hypothetical protein ABK040_000322 [Willaertia magna]
MKVTEVPITVSISGHKQVVDFCGRLLFFIENNNNDNDNGKSSKQKESKEIEWKITISMPSEFCEEYFDNNNNNSIEIILTKLNSKRTYKLIGKMDVNSEGNNENNFTHYSLSFKNPTKSGFFNTKYAIACKFIQKDQDAIIKPLLFLEIYSSVPNKYKSVVENENNEERISFTFHLIIQGLGILYSSIIFRWLWAYLTHLRFYCNNNDNCLKIFNNLFKKLQLTNTEPQVRQLFGHVYVVHETTAGESGLYILCKEYLKIKDTQASAVVLECIKKVIHWIILDNTLVVNHNLIVEITKNLRKTVINYDKKSLLYRLSFELNPIICLQKVKSDEVLEVICTINKYIK